MTIPKERYELYHMVSCFNCRHLKMTKDGKRCRCILSMFDTTDGAEKFWIMTGSYNSNSHRSTWNYAKSCTQFYDMRLTVEEEQERLKLLAEHHDMRG